MRWRYAYANISQHTELSRPPTSVCVCVCFDQTHDDKVLGSQQRSFSDKQHTQLSKDKWLSETLLWWYACQDQSVRISPLFWISVGQQTALLSLGPLTLVYSCETIEAIEFVKRVLCDICIGSVQCRGDVYCTKCWCSVYNGLKIPPVSAHGRWDCIPQLNLWELWKDQNLDVTPPIWTSQPRFKGRFQCFNTYLESVAVLRDCTEFKKD